MQSGDANAILRTSDDLGAFTLRLLAGVETQSGDLARASDYYAQSLAIEDNPVTRLALANSFLLRKYAARALAEARAVTAAHPDDPEAWQITGEALQLNNDQPRAVDAFSRAFALAPAPQNAILLVSAALALQQHDRTAHAFEQITQSIGENAGLHLLFATAYHQAGDLAGTIDEFNKALALAPASSVHLALGNAYWELNEYQYNPDSLREFTEAQRLAPADYFANYDLRSVQSQYHLFEDAARHLALAAQADPASPDPWIALGMNAYAGNDRTAARTDLEKATALAAPQESRVDPGIRRAYLVLSRLDTEAGDTARQRNSMPALKSCISIACQRRPHSAQ